ncbi:xylose isomerase [Sporanaerobium hydrogeniformans]|uniref:Xylose isomerase n=1 Tax=Sporanaerobium hydrogeniformans TaxID=3072179 RepID=A0AC61DHI6_9FIRM|nr:TIM barrel protein [Sporanaerobium hydrogeniformans]PHV72051.1 xylose isomerase [Sporanaerobium hydrogeniformans]
MKRLFHLSTTPKQLEWFEEDWEQIQHFIEKQLIDGIELGLTSTYPIDRIPQGLVEGVHLSFYPMWLDFWRGDTEKVTSILGSRDALLAYYGGEKKEVMVTSYKAQYERAKALGAKYMVFHVSHVLIEDTFTFKYDYTDEEVMEAAVELINTVFEDEQGPTLLFENLWWPGLNYMDPKLTASFLDKITYRNKGFLLDVSHLILTNPQIKTEEQAYIYIKKVVEALGTTKDSIKGVHLNKTLPKYYMQRDHSYMLKKYQEAKQGYARDTILKNHIRQLDGHQPFDHPIAKKIIELIQPEFCVYETAPNSRHELAYFIKKQNKALGILS